LRRYCHLGTGNYHPKTARLYEDFGLLTADPEIGEDVSHLFNVLSGYSMNTSYRRLLVAPHSVRNGLIERIDREIDHHRAGRPARIRFKCNSVVDERVIDALYRASQAGVPVDIFVRGICALRPGVPGLSDHIRVISVLGRFLEHSRTYEFANGGDTEVWIGSADLMHRNLDRRVETLVRIVAPEHKAEIGAVFDLAFDPGTASWHLDGEGVWTRRVRSEDGQRLRDHQETLIALMHRRG
jgi:polyphosphate kinase